MSDDIGKLQTSVAVLTERLNTFFDATIEYRKKKDEYFDKIHEDVTKMQLACIQHLNNNQQFKMHLEEHKLYKNTWGSRGFSILLIIITAAVSSLITLITKSVLK